MAILLFHMLSAILLLCTQCLALNWASEQVLFHLFVLPLSYTEKKNTEVLNFVFCNSKVNGLQSGVLQRVRKKEKI